MKPAAMAITRKGFLRGVGGATFGILAAAGRSDAAATSVYQSFRSRADLRPPRLSVTGGAATAGEGYLFVAPSSHAGAQAGPMIVDQMGQLVWFRPLASGRWASNFSVQQFRNAPALTWWEGVVDRASGYGRGTGAILDAGYRAIAHVRAGNGRRADLHELRLTPQGTALLTCYPETVEADLTRLGGPRNGKVLQSIIQEVDVSTGRLLFEWRSLEHIGPSESYCPMGAPYDYLHVNSIDLTPDGHLLVSARHTCAIYKLHRRSGRVLWRLGGRRSDFAMGPGTRFAWQHDARVHRGGQISLFDDGAGERKTESQSRGIVLEVSHHPRNVKLASSYRHRSPLLAYAMGNTQLLDDGNVIVAWGNVPVLSEFTPAGSLVMDLRLPWGHNTYRGFRLPWAASPTDSPAIALTSGTGGTRTLYASWNGATEVSSWQVSTGSGPSQLTPVLTAPRNGFETAIPLPVSNGYAQATALGLTGQPLGSSPVLPL